jgi:hypothetical protein
MDQLEYRAVGRQRRAERPHERRNEQAVMLWMSCANPASALAANAFSTKRMTSEASLRPNDRYLAPVILIDIARRPA